VLNIPHFSHSSHCDVPSTIPYHAICKNPVTISTLFTECTVLNTNNFFLNPQISNFMKIRPVGAKLFHADRRTGGRTNIMTLVVAFCQFFGCS
jgi:hypothetical protein